MPGLARLPEYAERVLEVVERIPPGHVLTYGEVARLVGSGGPGELLGVVDDDEP